MSSRHKEEEETHTHKNTHTHKLTHDCHLYMHAQKHNKTKHSKIKGGFVLDLDLFGLVVKEKQNTQHTRTEQPLRLTSHITHTITHTHTHTTHHTKRKERLHCAQFTHLTHITHITYIIMHQPASSWQCHKYAAL